MYRNIYISLEYRCAMLYDIITSDIFGPFLPERLELWLARVTGHFNEEERDIYDSLGRLEHVLRNGANIEELHAYRRQELKRVYDVYSHSPRNDFRPSFHKKIHQLIKRYDERIQSMEEGSE